MANVLLETREEENYKGEMQEVVSRLSLKPLHYNGTYKVSVTKETIKDGFVEFMMFADGNFNIKVGTGRKSAKKLDKLEQYLNKNKEELADAWKAGNYQYMVNTICQDVVAEKII